MSVSATSSVAISAENNESNSFSSSSISAVDSASSCSLSVNSRLDLMRKINKNKAVNNSNGLKIVNSKVEADPVIELKMLFSKPGPLKGGSSNASICALY